MTQRRYTDDDRTNALAALAANGGNLSHTARQTGIPRPTLRLWRDTPTLAASCQEKKETLAEALDRLAHALVGDLLKDSERNAARYRDKATTLGIAIDKARLLRGESTAINEQRGTLLDAIDTLTADAIARAAAREEASPVPADGPGQPLDTPGGP